MAVLVLIEVLLPLCLRLTLYRMSGPGRKPTISDDEILQVFTDTTDPVLTTNEVAEAIDMSRRGAFSRLDELASDSKLKRKKVGQTGAVWWYPHALREEYGNK